MLMQTRGFTLIEMVAVLAIVAILSVFAAATFNRLAFDTASFGRELESALAFAQKSAVAQRRTVTVTVTASSVSFAICSAFDPCGAAVALPVPSQGGGAVVTAPSGVTLSPAGSFSFKPDGGTSPSSTVTLTVTGAGANSVVIEGGTAYVHRG
jgi:MSHA pilin protein MshC